MLFFMTMKQKIMTLLLLCLPMAMTAAKTEDDARAVFEKAYDQIFKSDGCTFKYNVNLVGLYKTSGTIWYKGEKNKFHDAKVDSWSDGETMYMVYRKKKTVEIYDSKSAKADKYKSKFKFTLDDFTYKMEEQGDNLLITLKQKKGVKGTVKEAKALIVKETLAPVSIRIKVLFFWANIKITDFSNDRLPDSFFDFPKSRYKDYKIVDKRK